MRKFFLLLVLLCCGCGTGNIHDKKFDNNLAVCRVEYKGHSYLMFNGTFVIFYGMVHDPDCKCQK